MNLKFLLTLGTVSALIFWIGGAIAGLIHGDYNFVRDTVSELGALGTKSHYFMTVVMYLSSITGILFVISALMACRRAGISVIPAISAVGIPLTTIWAAFFPMGTAQHGMTGPVVFIIYIGVIISLFVWRGGALKTLWTWSVISLVLLLGIFLRFTAFFPYHEELIQRFAHLGWSVWFVAINIQLIKLLNLKSVTIRTA
ncbi:MAG TPA: DUF998 domain-containing protein [Mucilaginibacter sp.]|nr:DUF998 domain-containing protein [Mucilaginibacter sp.]